jgi:Tfp pilus assembly protein PilX
MKMVNRRSRTAHGRRGSALVAALCVVLMIGTLSMSYLQMSMNKNREQQTAADTKRAFYMAEAGLAEAYTGLYTGKSGNVGSDTLPARFGNGVFWVVAKDLGNRRTSLTSTGLCGSGRASISIVVENQRDSIASRGVFSNTQVTVQSGALVDSFDSRDGDALLGDLLPLGGPTFGSSARVSSNANVVIQGSTARSAGAIVQGDAHPGPGGVVLSGTGATITGSTTPSEEAQPLPAPRFPDIAQSGAIVHALASPPFAPPQGQVGYSSLHLKGEGQATLTGPLILLVDQLVLDPGTRLRIDTTNGPVKVYVRDWLNLSAGSTIDCPDEDPTRVALVCGGATTVDRNGDSIPDAPVTLAADGDFYGFVYAPSATVTVPSTFQLFGAVAADSLTVGTNARVHFDQALTDTSGDEGAVPQKLCWRLVQLPPSKLVETRLDPLRYLSLNSITPVLSKDAHYEKGIEPVTNLLRDWNLLNVVP